MAEIEIEAPEDWGDFVEKPTTADYLADLVDQKNRIADMLSALGMEASHDETLDTLVPKLSEAAEQVYAMAYAEGEQGIYELFWNTSQNNGSRRDYQYAFAYWSDELFRAFPPKYPVVSQVSTAPTSMNYLFYYSTITDLSGLLSELGMKDTFFNGYSQSSAGYIFNYCRQLTKLPTIKFITRNASDYVSFNYTFAACVKLQTIEGFYTEADDRFSNTFQYCSALENITFTGAVGNNINLSQSTKLTHDSLMSLINALEDKTINPDGKTYKVTLGATNLAKLTDAEKQIMDDKGWIYA